MINGVVAVPLMVVMMLIASRSAVMGDYVIRRRLKILGWKATGIMLAAVLALFAVGASRL